MSCRFCSEELTTSFCDLGSTPLSNSFLTQPALSSREFFFPLHAYVCNNCFLVQIQEVETLSSLFREYAYFSSYSPSWLEHASQYADQTFKRFNLSSNDLILEIASNDGYLLQYFKEKGLKILGIEPAKNVAKVAQDKGIPTITEFFGTILAEQLIAANKKADLLIANNVLAHVPDLNNFVKAMKMVLNPKGVITIEFPHLLQLIQNIQFDTIYHEHFSYFSLTSVENILNHFGLKIFDVDQIHTHGGSLRIYACHDHDSSKKTSPTVTILKDEESNAGMLNLDFYRQFPQKILKIKLDIWQFFIDAVSKNKKVVGYGAPAKGNTLLNFCGIRSDLLPFTVDKNPYKQGKYLPGTRIPIYDVSKIDQEKPDYLFILPWNLKLEIIEQMDHVRSWGCQFVIPLPTIEII